MTPNTPRLHHLAAEAAGRLRLSSPCRWCVVVYCALGRRPRLRPEVLGAVGRELHERGLLDTVTRRFDVRRLLAAAGMTWQPAGGAAR